jgi:hypothetical protein
MIVWRRDLMVLIVMFSQQRRRVLGSSGRVMDETTTAWLHQAASDRQSSLHVDDVLLHVQALASHRAVRRYTVIWSDLE